MAEDPGTNPPSSENTFPDVSRAGTRKADQPRQHPPTIEGYQVLGEIGHGGQGVVYQAIQKSTHRNVALKFLLGGSYASTSAHHRFEREIDLVSHLKHPNIVAVFDSGQTPDGRLFYVMDYVSGIQVTQYVREKKLGLEETLALFAVICDAVNHAHQRGVIHRDLKPSNILVDEAGNPQILDFGLAKATTGRAETLATLEGQVMGTLPYMSPEQTKGKADLIDTRTDVYALGVILYELLTGAYPYPVVGELAEVLKHIAGTEPRPLTRSWTKESGISQSTRTRSRSKCPIDDEVETIALKALSKERERRYQSAGELAEDVRHYLANEPIEAKRDSGLYILKKTLRRYRVPVAVVGLFVVMLGVFAVAMAVARNRALVAEVDARTQRNDAVAAKESLQAERDRANENARKAEERLASGLVLHGIALLSTDRSSEARIAFFEALTLARQLNLNEIPCGPVGWKVVRQECP